MPTYADANYPHPNEDTEEFKKGFTTDGYKNSVRSRIISQEITDLPNNPVKLFEHFKLPVTTISVDRFEGSGYKTIFEYNGSVHKRPELVAKAYYESLGYRVNWSEGVAWRVAISALELELFKSCYHLFAAKPGRLTKSQKKYIVEGTDIYREMMESMETERIKRQEKLEKTFGLNYIGQFLESAMNSNLSDLNERYLLENVMATPTVPPEQFREHVKNTVESIIAKKDIDSICNLFPKVPEKTETFDPQTKNLNEYSLSFAREILVEMDWRAIFRMYFEHSSFLSNSFDLTLFDFSKNIVRFVEVKFKDNFTKGQLFDLHSVVTYGLDAELAVVTVPK